MVAISRLLCKSSAMGKVELMYRVAIMDWHSRRVLSWRLSNTLDTEFCIEALEEALARYGAPEIFNSDSNNVPARFFRVSGSHSNRPNSQKLAKNYAF